MNCWTQLRRPHFSRMLLGIFLALCLGVPVSAREKKIIQKSATDPQLRAAETFLDQLNPTTVNSGLPVLEVQSLLNANKRAIVQFDFSSLPNVGIKRAILTLHVFVPTGAVPEQTFTYEAFPLASFFTQADATWTTRVADLLWGASGGDFGNTPTATARLTPRAANISWNITKDVQSWYAGTPNYGTIIRDRAENGSADADNDGDPGDPVDLGTEFSSNNDPNPANAPKLTVFFVQNVANLTATPNTNQVRLNWSYPAPLGTVVERNVGVLILRRANLPVDKASMPADGTNPRLCKRIGSGTVIFNSNALPTVFTDNRADRCGTPANGTTWYYKVFMKDSARNYSTSGTSAAGGSVFTSEISATPSATAPQFSNWMAATFSTNLAPPSLFPASIAMVGTQSNLLIAVNPNTGLRPYPAVSLGGAISGRSPIIDAPDSSLLQNVIYVADQSGLTYAVATDTGQILWVVDPIGKGGTPFLGAGSVVVKKFADPSYTRTGDLFVLGTRNSATTSGNEILGIDGNTGATVWQTVGATGSVPPMDIIVSTPVISFSRSTIWVTSHSNSSTTQPSLWDLDANTGKVLATDNLGNIDSSPVLTPDESTLFVGNNAGTVYAIDPSTGAVLASFVGGDGAIIDYPLVVGFGSPYTVVFSGATGVHALSYDVGAKTFTALWNTTINTPSAPISVFGLSDVYVGSNDGTIHELDLASGADIRDEIVNKGQPGFVGDPSLDLSLMRIYVSTTDQRMYAFPFPF
ncbi:MAG: DNRLRE domain-containing protein [Candidatus Acidiferrales bacterium]